MKEEIDNIKEKIKKELKADLYNEVCGIFNSIYNRYTQLEKFCEDETKRKDYYAEQYNKEVEEKVKARSNEEKWRKYYTEVCQKQAQVEIELDTTKAKVELLEKEGKIN